MSAGIVCFCIWILKLPQWYIDTEKLMKADSGVLKIQFQRRELAITPEYKVINMIRQTQLPHTQIFRLNTKELESNISQLQPVKKVYIRRYWFPARLVISIDERIPAFLLAPNIESEPNSALTTDGVLIDHDYLPLNPSIKAKKLLTYGVRNGHEEVWDKKKVDEITKLVKAIETYSNQQVQYVDIRAEKDVYIMLEEYLIRFGEIDDTAIKRAKRIGTALSEAKKINEKIKYLDLRWEDSLYIKKDAKNKEEKKLMQKIAQEDKKIDKNQEKELEKNTFSDVKNNVEDDKQ